MHPNFTLHSVQTKLSVPVKTNFLAAAFKSATAFVSIVIEKRNATTTTTPNQNISFDMNDSVAAGSFLVSDQLCHPELAEGSRRWLKQYTLNRTEGKLVAFNKVGETHNTAFQKTPSFIKFFKKEIYAFNSTLARDNPFCYPFVVCNKFRKSANH